MTETLERMHRLAVLRLTDLGFERQGAALVLAGTEAGDLVVESDESPIRDPGPGTPVVLRFAWSLHDAREADSFRLRFPSLVDFVAHVDAS